MGAGILRTGILLFLHVLAVRGSKKPPTDPNRRTALRDDGPYDFISLTSAYTSSYSLPTTLGSSSSSHPQRVRVMAYNVQQLPPIFKGRDQNKRLKELLNAFDDFATTGGNDATQIHPETPDVVVFNELYRPFVHNELKRRLSHVFPYYTGVIGEHCSSGNEWTSIKGCSFLELIKMRGGIAIFSRHPISETHGLVFAAKTAWTADAFVNKGAVLAKILIPDDKNENNQRPVWVMGTHLQADENSKPGGGIREKQAAEFTAWIDEGVKSGAFKIDRNKDPVIVAGDLNVEFKGTPRAYRKMMDLTKLRVNLTALDLKAGDYVGSLSPLTNWLAKADYYSYSLPLDFDDTLDYVGYRRDFRHPVFAPHQRTLPLKAKDAWYWSYLKRWWNLPGEGRKWNKGYYKDISDHYPVVADFYF